MDIQLSDAERTFIIHGMQQNLRNDGRRFTESHIASVLPDANFYISAVKITDRS